MGGASDRGAGAGTRGSVAFRIVVLVALVAAVGQVGLGGVVRVTDSGLGCPDWPLCHGRIVPPLEVPALIEYSHRLAASLLGALVVAGTVLAWRGARDNRPAIVSISAALALVVVAALLGAITVLTELAWWIVMLHLALAEIVVACIVIASVAGWKFGTRERLMDGLAAEWAWFHVLLAVTLMGTFALIMSGSYMVGLGYGSSCGTWPLCNGSFLPDEGAYLVHMAHRYVAGLVGVLIAAVATWAWYRRGSAQVGWAALSVAGLFLVQSLLGAATVWTGFEAELKSVHLVVATLVWVALVYLVALVFADRRLEFRRAEESPGRLSELEGATL